MAQLLSKDLRLGRPKGTTHRIAFLWELGKRGFEEGEITQV